MSRANVTVDLKAFRSQEEADRFWMQRAIGEAEFALESNERPFGCVIVQNGVTIARGRGSETRTDPTRHSEIVAIHQACYRIGGLLHGCTLYSTHECCAMCCGAINHAKLSRVVFGSYRSDLGVLFRRRNFSAADLLADTSHPPDVVGGVCQDECIGLFASELLQPGDDDGDF